MVVFCCNSVNGVRVPAAELDSWICFVNTESRSVATLFISRLIDIGRHFGVRISPPHMWNYFVTLHRRVHANLFKFCLCSEPLGQCLCSQCLAANLWAYLGRKRYRYAVCFADVWNTEMSSTVLRVTLKEYGVPCEVLFRVWVPQLTHWLNLFWLRLFRWWLQRQPDVTTGLFFKKFKKYWSIWLLN